MRIGKEDAHRLPKLGLRHRDDARRVMPDHRERCFVRYSDSQPLRQRVGAVGRHRSAGGEGQRVSRRVLGDDADHLGRQPQSFARCDDTADAAAEADRHIDRVESRDGTKHFQRIARDAAYQQGVERAHEMEIVPFSQNGGVLVGGLEIVADLDQRGAEPAHRPVFAGIVALRHDDRRREAERAGGIGDALPVIARRCRHDAADLRPRLAQLAEIHDAAADLEGAGRRMVLVLDPELGADPPRQQRPTILRCRRDDRVYERGGLFERGKIGKFG